MNGKNKSTQLVEAVKTSEVCVCVSVAGKGMGVGASTSRRPDPGHLPLMTQARIKGSVEGRKGAFAPFCLTDSQLVTLWKQWTPACASTLIHNRLMTHMIMHALKAFHHIYDMLPLSMSLINFF